MTTAPAIIPGHREADAARLALAQHALEIYRTRCFWSLAPDFVVSGATISLIIDGLRRHGDRAAFQLASRLCR